MTRLPPAHGIGVKPALDPPAQVLGRSAVGAGGRGVVESQVDHARVGDRSAQLLVGQGAPAALGSELERVERHIGLLRQDGAQRLRLGQRDVVKDRLRAKLREQ
jgi:hypothetical protein